MFELQIYFIRLLIEYINEAAICTFRTDSGVEETVYHNQEDSADKTTKTGDKVMQCLSIVFPHLVVGVIHAEYTV